MYDPELLRTFVAVAQSLSFTRAAESLGLRQPTVSQHVRRLEDAVGRPLFVRDTRSVALTSDGEAMAGFAREILAAQERAVGYFTGSHLQGRLRFGVTDDLALTPLPRILRDFRQLYPRIDLELTVLQNDALVRRIESGHLDVAFVKRGADAPKGLRGQLVRRDQLIWCGLGATRIEDDQPVPLVVYQAPSLSRAVSVQALEKVGRRSRITCTVRGVNGVLAAVRAGLGIAVLARTLMPADLVELPASLGLPKLPHLDLVLLTNRSAPPEAAKALTSAILASGAPLTTVGAG
ncbi:DNA-binding transcriptional regulator, LysR family [Pedococcus dokdonensis]|uniref:DNA-binding transcriptional regulator, LysR family n=1 Tax=Pedococcus dokdonensis TaxID=443156 RepID=A0A1H0MFA1_9MICO|nr:LysR substrate-binding domain-containing protein [Pedococcus dokdonensis]SDO78840.1 DNA-binding transcriptional regulator, LysR family [Pedococcus dokdonensis]